MKTRIAIPAIAVAIFAFSSLACTRSSPTAAFKANDQAFKAKDLAAYKKTLSKRSLEDYENLGKRQNQSLDEVLRNVLQTGIDEYPMTPETRNEKIAGNIATVEVKNKKGDWDKIVLYKEDGEWKVGGMAIGLEL